MVFDVLLKALKILFEVFDSKGNIVLLVLLATLLPCIAKLERLVIVGPEIEDVEFMVPITSKVYDGEVCLTPIAFDVMVITGKSLLDVPSNNLCVAYLGAITISSINEFEKVSLFDATNSMKTALSVIILSLTQKK